MRTTVLIITLLGLLGCGLPTGAQIVPPVRTAQAVVDPAMTFEERGQTLEIYSRLRAKATVAPGTGSVQHKLSSAAESTPIGPQSLGVVFNHALQVQGFLTGEITFKPRNEGLPADMDAAGYPGLAKVTNPNIYLVVAASPKEFINRLKARTDLEWVEAVVIYGAAAMQAPAAARPTR